MSAAGPERSRRAAVIGAGVAGLTAGYRLARAGYEVTVFESAAQTGGLASGFRAEGWEWPLERFYHHLFASDAHIRRLVDEIGMGQKLFFQRPVTAQWWEGRAYALDSPAAVLRFPGIGVPDRVRFGAAVAYLRFLCRDWRKLETSTASAWCRRAMGDRAYQALLRPLLEGKFGEHYEQVNTAWLWARFKARTPSLGYFEGGFQAFAEALAQAICGAGSRVLTGQSISGISRGSDGQWTVAAGEASQTFDAVIATVSPSAMSRLAPDLPGDYLESVRSLKSLGAMVLTIALDRPLMSGVYWLNVPKPRFPFLALVEHTNFIEPRRYGGQHLIYCGDYIPAEHEYFRLSASEILDRFLPSLKLVNAQFAPEWVKDCWMHREPYAQPVVSLNHSRRIPPLATPLPGLYWASMSQVYPWDRGTNFAVELGEIAASEVIRNSVASAD